MKPMRNFLDIFSKDMLLVDENTIAPVKSGGGSIIPFGCFSSVILVKVRGILNGSKYQLVLPKNL